MRLPPQNLLAVAFGLQAFSGHGLRTRHGAHIPMGVCETDTIKYAFLQLCPGADWYLMNNTDRQAISGTVVETAPKTERTGNGAEEDPEELATSSFMSFEEWKTMMLQKTGQDPADLKERKRRELRDRAGVGPNDILDSWGDDGEIALDFDALPGKITDVDATENGGAPGEANHAEEAVPAVQGDGMVHYRRPKDAGKTCKERFSYASFDGGATILKTSPGTQNPKAILVENKDAYMLFTCSQENKFVIVELSEDILVDTVVLANFEFFSSTIRSFRVSVSDKYPVKMDKWKDIGTYQARNSRDIQSFLIENPKIYAKYIRIEFLSHYGKEYYCPVSLLRVHGTRMLDSWKDVENAVSEDDDSVEAVDSPEAVPEPESPQENTVPEPEATLVAEHIIRTTANVSFKEYGLSPWYPPLHYEISLETCAISTPTTKSTASMGAQAQAHMANGDASQAVPRSKADVLVTMPVEATVPPTPAAALPTNTSSLSVDTPANTRTSETPRASIPSTDPARNKTQVTDQAGKPHVTPPPKPSPASKPDGSSNKPTHRQTPNNVANKNSSGTTSSATASPTIQESFFKSITKRITYLEGNVTLSLQYIEEQSKFLQDALQKMERRQIKRVDDFLHHLNKTVLGDIVLTLEGHRQILDRHDRQILALSAQMNHLAGDVGILKLMMIILIVLNVCGLLLALLSRGVQSGTAAEQWANTGQFFNTYLGSPRMPPGSPQSRTAGNITPTQQQRLPRRQSAGPGPVMRHPINSNNSSATGSLQPGGGQRSVSGPAAAASLTDKVLPLTPTSDVFDRSDSSPTPPSARTVVRAPPQIRVDEPEADDVFGEHKQRVTGLGISTRPLIEELPTPLDEAATFMNGREDGKGIFDDDDDDDDTTAYEDDRPPSKPPLTRSPLSELVGSSRKPLPALPEDPT